MNLSKRQGELFTDKDYLSQRSFHRVELPFKRDVIEAWQKRISSYQESIFQNISQTPCQGSMFESIPNDEVSIHLNPLKLTPLPLNFWQWPKSSHHGPAIYLVMDKIKALNSHILLYIGETVAAEKRWKGEHDCKNYLQAYCEACQKAGLTTQLSIRFWADVPKKTKPRRDLEQKLIQKWLPAFNKETKGFWSTPFTNEIK
ncbi:MULTISPECIES: hypothetical protein [Prochlorococcus]|uniref:Cyanobacteria-specific protein containing UvrC-like endonuclease domain n=1 Tax=Prochlorococcus marinus (strain SARG / CCMP1375 / SS120) TaxID=167539 RepID=Q7VAP5_PROMA|nr:MULTISPECIES: hypothetical protein [Prochlorococcus]AAQ00456.1 cyanobacteria-specific protein containing UvrC-like endonuclease domain [Prochlorococcus marinus subsp. marinus str. CCMP1375]KGG14337.1 Cyanobacteria-specific protein containing UvrC-like endonuclease domain [Prochlorococcus marinus str. LG]KGG22089.1 Cyanobacteria-specific protein containing UvrC-like endonuclease domain [Prochlorococcus marinus str. SS2]KGG24593.1 Cyanobacteria-specific protein containing UvrC-like endonucleas